MFGNHILVTFPGLRSDHEGGGSGEGRHLVQVACSVLGIEAMGVEHDVKVGGKLAGSERKNQEP